MKLLVVIVCYKVVDLTINCLRSIEPEIKKIAGARVAVCENGTGADAVDKLQRAIDENGWATWVDLSSITPNRGFTGGNNCVIRPALAAANPPDYVLLLNADTEAESDALQSLVDFMDQHPRVGVAGSQLLSPDGTVQGSPFQFEGMATQFNRGVRLGVVTKMLRKWVEPPSQRVAGPVDWVSGASMIIRRDVFSKIGLLDEDYYTYFDDIDFCLNAWRAGGEVWYFPGSRIMHLEGCSTGIDAGKKVIPRRRPAYWFEARRRYFLKNYGALYAARVDAAFIAGHALWRLHRMLRRLPDNDPPALLIDSIRHSVFMSGFKLRAVENPAMRRGVTNEMVASAS